ncbi:hypothetical protein TBLA_0D02520 [Henningerozyma blattae CBS 6284]|uniref:Fatty acid hydroxylase domain-containing protein n=1 Tax=Henningerozyma blattae (strain ATCC 34711 / CBS 6284 / DSM 70876 / NBRC 10599 / NRRL Y-10934 / UCD 77-7) TaxID=1071380 RepID=I2H303_HENB6|nr:hypothetical protein TBLA_0D02520 [Tetrapisispora blattae CBS 6284]CCH60755.1 hypothetical protein TBLA_0D02520 [Tetrapisispora blattae CBS 6284]
MDLVLEVCDSYFLDNWYTRFFPVSMATTIDPKWVSKLQLSTGTSNVSCLVTGLNNQIKNVPWTSRINPEIYGYTPYLMEMSEASFGSIFPRFNVIRQFISMLAIVTVFGWILYFVTASLSYMFVFDKNIFNHPRYLKNQMILEIRLAMSAIPVMSMLTVPWFILELHGHSNLHIDFGPHGKWSILQELVTFIMFTDCGIYLLHRWLHWPLVYKHLHKPHHKWLVCTPFASHAFHPVDGYFQSLPYHIYPMLMPLNKVLYLFLFSFVNFWTVMIHDGNHMSNNPYVNGTACHTVHHLYFNYNYGQFTTLWDRLGGSYRKPEDELFNPQEQNMATWTEQVKEIDAMKVEVEGNDDDRVYDYEVSSKKLR